MSYLPSLLLSLILCIASWGSGAPSSKPEDPLHFFKIIDLPHPYCEGSVDLAVAKEFFTEIANDLIGRNEYNELIRYYRNRRWVEFDTKWAQFRNTMSDSPLIEAGGFLYVQSLLDRIDRDDGIKSKAAERYLRELVLQYPKSTLAPVLWASLGAYFLRQTQVTRALATYEVAQKQYPSHALGCIFAMGQAEASFLIRDWKSATPRYQVISQKCENTRLKTAALVRLADSEWLQGLPGADVLYGKIVADQSSYVERFFPSALYNLGEIKYRAGHLPEARFYFEEFIRMEDKSGKCMPHAQKRLADIAFRSDIRWERAAGLYLAVQEQYPHTDVGRYSYIHGLLMGLPTFSRIEYKRRLKVIDDQIDNIKDESLRSLAYLEKGLALLDAGEKDAMDYLVRLNQKAQFRVRGGTVGKFVRDKLLSILKAEVQKALNEKSDVRVANDEALFGPMEAAFGLWLKGSEYESPARKFYSDILLHRFTELMGDDDLPAALEKLERWQKSALWDPKGPSWEVRRLVGGQLADFVFDFEGDQDENPAYLLLKKEKELKPFVEPEFHLIWFHIALKTNDNLRLKKLASLRAKNRMVASVDARLPEEVQSRLWLVAAQSALALGQFNEALAAFGKVQDEGLMDQTLKGLMTLHRRSKAFGKAFDAGKSLLGNLRGEARNETVEELYDIATEGKLWKQTAELLDWAKELTLPEKELARFQFLAGRGFFESGNFKRAIESYESGLKGDPEGPLSREARYRLGKALLKDNRRGQAAEVFRELAERKDSFWSPLARAEAKQLK